MSCQSCSHTYFQHGGAGGPCNMPGCSCLAWVEPADPEALASAQEAVRQAAIAKARQQIEEATATLQALGAEPMPLRKQAIILLTSGATAQEVAQQLQCGLSTVHLWARKAGVNLPKGRPPTGLRALARALAAEGLAVPQIAERLERSERTVQWYLKEDASAGNEKK